MLNMFTTIAHVTEATWSCLLLMLQTPGVVGIYLYMYHTSRPGQIVAELQPPGISQVWKLPHLLPGIIIPGIVH